MEQRSSQQAQQAQTHPGVLPESSFIAINRSEWVQPAMTTATTVGRATMRKQRAAPKKRTSKKKKAQASDHDNKVDTT
ncbi:hypothetical protein EJB05_54726 [Eragrostis curvula]|uniref:Uncharacterized protein n=1 Tax=Eragrostis curvula TaxID=38414 RepID=A0A5J9SLM7_9POAL|nr:hypothetical protein EJB05_54726 [Eragrostis curvula]